MSIMLPPISDDDALELKVYLDVAIELMGHPDSPGLRQLLSFLGEKCREIEDERWRNDPRNWGASCKWPYEDDLPF